MTDGTASGGKFTAAKSRLALFYYALTVYRHDGNCIITQERSYKGVHDPRGITKVAFRFCKY